MDFEAAEGEEKHVDVGMDIGRSIGMGMDTSLAIERSERVERSEEEEKDEKFPAQTLTSEGDAKSIADAEDEGTHAPKSPLLSAHFLRSLPLL